MSGTFCVDGANCGIKKRYGTDSLPSEVVPYAYRLALVRLLGDARDFERRHYARLSGAADAATGSMLELPRGVVVTVFPDGAEKYLSESFWTAE